MAASSSAVEPRYEPWWNDVKRAIARYGDKLPVDLTVAQAHYESVRAKVPSSLAYQYNNLFGIKRAKRDFQFQTGGYVTKRTKEYEGTSREMVIEDEFAAYKTLEDSVRDLVRITSYEAFRRHLVQPPPSDPAERERVWAQALVKYGYATEPRYADELLARREWLRRNDSPLNYAPPKSGNPPKLPVGSKDFSKEIAMFDRFKNSLSRLYLRFATWYSGSSESVKRAVDEAVRYVEARAREHASPDKLRLALETAVPKVELALDAAINVPLIPDSWVDAAIHRALVDAIERTVSAYEKLLGTDWGQKLLPPPEPVELMDRAGN